jgi:hypothetical protein
MKRLNLVMQELDRVKREKEELLNRIAFIHKDQLEVNRMINHEDNIDKVNQYMQDDLVYERDRNYKM